MPAVSQDADDPLARENVLRRLNAEYVRASLASDVPWFRTHLAPDFVCIESDGSMLSRDAFLRMLALGSDLAEYRLDEVDVRVYGDVALVRASGSWTRQDGIRGTSRYTDVYVHTGDAWQVVSAQVTRPGQPGDDRQERRR